MLPEHSAQTERHLHRFDDWPTHEVNGVESEKDFPLSLAVMARDAKGSVQHAAFVFLSREGERQEWAAVTSSLSFRLSCSLLEAGLTGAADDEDTRIMAPPPEPANRQSSLP